MLKKETLRTIQSADKDEWYYAVTKEALYMATAGFIEEANRLLEALWKHKLPHDRNTWLPDRAFEVLWDASGSRPSQVPFEQIAIDRIEIKHRAYSSGDNYAYKMPDVSWNELTGKNAFRQGMIFAALQNGQMPDPIMELRSLQLLEKALVAPESLASYEFCSATSLAAELAAKNDDFTLAKKMAKLWAEKYHEYYLGYNFSIMASNRHMSKLLLNGTIATELRIDKAKCSDFVEQAIKAIDQRIKNGYSLVYQELDWSLLIKKLSVLSIDYAPEDFTVEQIENQWLGSDKAKEEDIVKKEKMLGLVLPEDYKQFLEIANGMSAFPFLNPALLGVENIEFVKTKHLREGFDFEGLKDLCEINGLAGQYLEKTICISESIDDIEVWLIPPIADSDEWQCLYFDKYGGQRFSSFRYFFENRIQHLEND